MTDSDWIGIQALTAASYRIDPGGADDASNMFVYTCKGGWIDFGHVLYSALAYKVIYQGLRGNPIVKFGMNKFLTPDEAQLFNDVKRQRTPTLREVLRNNSDTPFHSPRMRELVRRSVEIRIKNHAAYTKTTLSPKKLKELTEAETEAALRHLNSEARSKTDKKELFFGYWTGYFAMQAGYAIEIRQNKGKVERDPAVWKGDETSAWALEDLPSDFYGVQLGSRLQEKATVGSVVKQIKQELSQMMSEFGAVDLNNVTETKGCSKTAGEVLKNDTRHYVGVAEKTRVTHKEADSQNPDSPYNYTIGVKRTRSHACVCDKNDNPINRKSKAVIREPARQAPRSLHKGP